MRKETIEACRRNEQLAEEHFAAALDACWTSLAEAQDAVARCSGLFSELKDEKLHDLLLIVVNCVSDVGASLMAMRQGFFHASGVILRPAVENAACAICFNTDNKAYQEFKLGNFHAPSAIVQAKKHFPEFGKLYGLLTETFTHEPVAMLARGVSDFGGKLGYVNVPPLDKTERTVYLTGFVMISLAANLCGEILELFFSHHLDKFTFWERIEPDQIKRKKTTGMDKALAMSTELDFLLKHAAQ